MSGDPTCREVVEFLLSYFEGELEAAQRDAFERHLTACGCCQNYLESYRRSVEMAKAAMTPARAPEQPVPEGLIRAILAAKQRPT